MSIVAPYETRSIAISDEPTNASFPWESVAETAFGDRLSGTFARSVSGSSWELAYLVVDGDTGIYSLTVGPQVLDLAGRAMDQNRDGVSGTPEDVYAGSFAIDVSPDLTVSQLTAPTVAVTDETIQVIWTVDNAGTYEAAGTWYDRVWLSTDQQVDGRQCCELDQSPRPDNRVRLRQRRSGHEQRL